RRAVTLTSPRNFGANSGSFANAGSSTFIAPRMSPPFSTERTIPIPPWPSLPRTTHLVPGMGSPMAYSIELGVFMASLRAVASPAALPSSLPLDEHASLLLLSDRVASLAALPFSLPHILADASLFSRPHSNGRRAVTHPFSAHPWIGPRPTTI